MAPTSPVDRSEPSREREAAGPQAVSARWLLTAYAVRLPPSAAAALCAWGALCLLFWQGGWQLLYHPAAAVANTPANVGLAFEAVAFGVTEDGTPLLRGW